MKLQILTLVALSFGCNLSQKGDDRIEDSKAGTTFMVASYNVENLFDQVDAERNRGYGAYRMVATEAATTNWSEGKVIDGIQKSFSEIKADGIRKVLLAIKDGGPEIVGLQEIESQGATDLLFDTLKDLGYIEAKFSGFVKPEEGQRLNGIGMAILSKFPITDYQLLEIANPTSESSIRRPLKEKLRGVMKATIRVKSSSLVVYNNHWKSKGGPESWRMACAAAVEADIQSELETNPNFDYVILGDLNSDYQESKLLVGNKRHNDTEGKSGIEDILLAQGNEELVATDLAAKYNLHYELPESERRTYYWSGGDQWSAIDHLIVGGGLYDRQGISYIDNSFDIADFEDSRFEFLFKEKEVYNRETGITKKVIAPFRWQWIRTLTSEKEAKLRTYDYQHQGEGYSDHLPIFAEFLAR